MRSCCAEIAVAAGSQSSFAGQVSDLEAEGRKTDRAQLRYIHENKTAAILTTTVRLGAMSANADAKKLERSQSRPRAWDSRSKSSTTFSTSRRQARNLGRARAKMCATGDLSRSDRFEKITPDRQLTSGARCIVDLQRKDRALHAIANYLLEREY